MLASTRRRAVHLPNRSTGETPMFCSSDCVLRLPQNSLSEVKKRMEWRRSGMKKALALFLAVLFTLPVFGLSASASFQWRDCFQ